MSKIDDEILIDEFLDATSQIWSYKSLPAHVFAFHPNSENKVKIFFYDYNNDTMWKLADFVRPILFLYKDSLYWSKITSALSRLYENSDSQITEFEKSYDKWRSKKDFSLDEASKSMKIKIDDNSKVNFRLFHRKQMLSEDIIPKDLRTRWDYAQMYLNKFKWHSKENKTYSSFSTFEKKIAHISTVSLLIDSVELITSLRALCYTFKSNKKQISKKSSPKSSRQMSKGSKEFYASTRALSEGSIWQGPFVEIPASSVRLLEDLKSDGLGREIFIRVDSLSIDGPFGKQEIRDVAIYCRSGIVTNHSLGGNRVRVTASIRVMGCNVVMFCPDLISSGRLMQGEEPWERGLST